MQFFDVSFGTKRDDRLLSLVNADDAGGSDRLYQGSQLHLFGANAAALDSVQAHLDGVVVALIVVLIHGDVVHPHGVLLGNRGGVGQSHRVSVKANLAFAARDRRFFRLRSRRLLLVAVDRKVIAALRILLRLRRPEGRAAWITVVENWTVSGGGLLGTERRTRHGSLPRGVPISASSADSSRDDEQQQQSEAGHRSPPMAFSISASETCCWTRILRISSWMFRRRRIASSTLSTSPWPLSSALRTDRTTSSDFGK